MRFALSMLVFSVASISACHDHVVIDDACGEPAYGGKASDEAWLTIIDGYELAVPGPNAASIVSPAADAVLMGNPQPLTWTTPLDSAALLPASPLAPRSLVDRSVGLIASLFTSTARAHLPPVNGDIHYVELEVPGQACPIRALTTDETWTPTEDEWELMRGRGTITLTLTSAFLSNNRITEGPFRTTSRFEVE